MAIGVIATIPVQEGKNEEFEAVFMELAAQVIANEPGCSFYTLNRSKSDPQTYKVLESYVTKPRLKHTARLITSRPLMSNLAA